MIWSLEGNCMHKGL